MAMCMVIFSLRYADCVKSTKTEVDVLMYLFNGNSTLLIILIVDRTRMYCS